MNKDTETTFVRRKFTITEELDAELERIADNNYQGNVSLCLRQAIADHRETLRGNGEVTQRHLVESIAHIEDKICDLTKSVNKITEQSDQSHTGRPERLGPVGDEAALDSGTDQILTALEEASTPLRVADIIERVEMQPIYVRDGLGHLVDHGHVFCTGDDPPRYHLATIGLSSTEQNNSRGMSR